MNEEQDVEELSPENYPKGAQFLTDDFYWDCTDDSSPFGNDDGADAFYFFRIWRRKHSEVNPTEFLDQLFVSWQIVNDYRNVIDSEEAQKLLEQNEFIFLTHDNAVIAVAFGQLLLEGRIHPDVKRYALLALNRQLLPPIINTVFESDYVPERSERLEKMKAVIRQH